jgi:hypothetical protein
MCPGRNGDLHLCDVAPRCALDATAICIYVTWLPDVPWTQRRSAFPFLNLGEIFFARLVPSDGLMGRSLHFPLETGPSISRRVVALTVSKYFVKTLNICHLYS